MPGTSSTRMPSISRGVPTPWPRRPGSVGTTACRNPSRAGEAVMTTMTMPWMENILPVAHLGGSAPQDPPLWASGAHRLI